MQWHHAIKEREHRQFYMWYFFCDNTPDSMLKFMTEYVIKQAFSTDIFFLTG